MKRLRHILIASLLLLPALAQNAAACAACFGQTDDRQAVSMNAGIFSLLFVVVLVLSGIAAFFIFLASRNALFAVPGEDSFSEPATRT